MAKQKISLNYYKMKVEKEDNIGKPIILCNGIDGKDIYEIFKEFYKDYTDYTNDEKDLKIFSLIKHVDKQEHNGTYFGGMSISTGDYGYVSDIISIDSHELKYKKTESDADVMPFSIFFTSPKIDDCTYMIMAYQNRGGFGAKTVFDKFFRMFFKENYPDYKVIISPIAPSDYFKQLLENNTIKELQFTKYLEDGNTRKGLDRNSGIISSKSVDKIFNSPYLNQKAKKKLLNITEAGKRVCDYGTIEGLGDDYDDIKVKFDVDGSSKTVNIRKLSALMYSEDISGDLNNGDSLEELIPIFKEKCYKILKDFAAVD